MGNINIKSDEGKRKKILKKAALLATAASITSAISVGNQKPKESEALIGAIIGVVTTLVGIGGSVAQGVLQSEAEKKAQREAEEEERRRQEQERMQHQLDTSSEHNVRVNQTEEEEEVGKEINISVADNSSVSGNDQDLSSIRNSGGLQKPPSPPKGIHVGGFGEDSQEDNKEQMIQNNEAYQNEHSNLEEIKENVATPDVQEPQENLTQNIQEYKEEKPQVNNSIKGEVPHKDTQIKPPKNDNTTNVNINNNTNKDESKENNNIIKKPLNINTNSSGSITIDLGGKDESDIPSNMIKFDITEKEDDDGVIYDEIIVSGGRSLSNKIDDMEFEIDDSMLMDLEEAEEHYLVQEGFLSVEDLVLLDFGIRNGSITSDILFIMYENGDITHEYYEASMELYDEIQEELV